jgi:membrane-bound serine protease (ClpP class)
VLFRSMIRFANLVAPNSRAIGRVLASRVEPQRFARWLAAGLLLCVLPPTTFAVAAGHADRFATLVVLDGAIGPAVSRYVERAIVDAHDQHSSVVVLQVDTPGGLDSSMRDIIKSILASPVPVVTYVAPSGARAASAGTYILYASHLAAMAPATNLGAATPIPVGGEPVAAPPTPAGNPGDANKPAKRIELPGTAGERKSVNDAVAYIRGLAQLRHRNADWAENAVRAAASLSAEDALQLHVIDVIAMDVPDLLRQIHGRRISIADRDTVLDTKSLTVHRVVPDWRTRLLAVLTHPTIAYGLLLIAIYGLLLEGYNPGAVLPGVVGAVSLLLALYALQLLQVNYAGIALIALGVGLMIAEFFMPTFGSLGVGGLTAFVIGSIILLDRGTPGMGVALPLIAGLATAGAIVILTIGLLAARARRRPVSTGVETMIGASVDVINDIQNQGMVRYGGELWNAYALSPLRAGQRARIVRVVGLALWVEPQSSAKE